MLIALASLLTAACAKHYPIAGAPAPEQSDNADIVFAADVPLRIESRFYADIVLSIEKGGIRTRLATITASTNRDLMIPKRFFTTGVPIRLLAEGIGTSSGGERSSVITSALLIRPGQRIVWNLETQLERSSVGVY